MLKAGAKEERTVTERKKYALKFTPMVVEEVKQEERFNPGDQDMSDSDTEV